MDCYWGAVFSVCYVSKCLKDFSGGEVDVLVFCGKPVTCFEGSVVHAVAAVLADVSGLVLDQVVVVEVFLADCFFSCDSCLFLVAEATQPFFSTVFF